MPKTHHRSPQTPKADKGWEWKKTEMGVAQTQHQITATHPKAGTQKENRDGWPSTNHNKYPKAGDSKKTEMGGAGMHLAITTPTALFGTKEGVVVPIEEETEGRRFASKLPFQHKKAEEEEEEEKKNGRKLKKTQRDRGKERFVWMNEWMDGWMDG